MHQVHGGTRKGSHTVVFVGEESLPEGNDWAFIDVEGDLYLAIKRDHWSPELMAEAWAGYAAAC